VIRHHLGRTAADVLAATRGVAALHSSDPATPYLALRARVARFLPADLNHALLVERNLWRLHAMRRTLFVVPAAEAALFEAAATREVSRRERRRVEEWLAAEVPANRVRALLAELEARVLEVLDDGAERRTQELTAAIPELGTEITLGSGKWTTRAPLASRLLFLMAMDGAVVRTRPAGSWRSSQYHWAATARWFAAAPAEPPFGTCDPTQARVEVLRRYLASHGPATTEDIRWWTGWTARDTAAALEVLGADRVNLDGGVSGLVLREDDGPVAIAAEPVTLLPALDPSPMGWKERGWFLSAHAERLFDRNGNVGPTVWVGGRVVGGWAQRPDGDVVHRLLEDVGVEAAAAIAAEAASLREWLAGEVVIPRFRTPLERILNEAPNEGAFA
jgi:hypothetical protein